MRLEEMVWRIPLPKGVIEQGMKLEYLGFGYRDNRLGGDIYLFKKKDRLYRFMEMNNSKLFRGYTYQLVGEG